MTDESVSRLPGSIEIPERRHVPAGVLDTVRGSSRELVRRAAVEWIGGSWCSA